nr:MAG TPA: hypothetical protein [Caudoviricetes sp.]
MHDNPPFLKMGIKKTTGHVQPMVLVPHYQILFGYIIPL